MKFIFYLFWIIVIIVAVTFASLNAGIIQVNYYVNVTNIRLPILLLITLVIGALLGIIAMMPILIKAKNANRRLKQKVKQIELEVNNLRAIPIKETH